MLYLWACKTVPTAEQEMGLVYMTVSPDLQCYTQSPACFVFDLFSHHTPLQVCQPPTQNQPNYPITCTLQKQIALHFIRRRPYISMLIFDYIFCGGRRENCSVKENEYQHVFESLKQDAHVIFIKGIRCKSLYQTDFYDFLYIYNRVEGITGCLNHIYES